MVSTCEELAWPFERHHLIARRIDDQAVAAGCSVVGTGLNPGFLMVYSVRVSLGYRSVGALEGDEIVWF